MIYTFVSFDKETHSGYLNEDASAKALQGPAAHGEPGREEPLGLSSAEVV